MLLLQVETVLKVSVQRVGIKIAHTMLVNDVAENRHRIQTELGLVRTEFNIKLAAGLEEGTDLFEKFGVHVRAPRSEETIIDIIIHLI